MKRVIETNVSFDPATGWLDTGIEGFELTKLYAIINQTAAKVLFATGIQGVGISEVDGGSVHLTVDTTGMNAGDTIQLIYESNDDIELLEAINTELTILRVLGLVRDTNALRVNINNQPVIGAINSIGNANSGRSLNADQFVPAYTNSNVILSNINNIVIS